MSEQTTVEFVHIPGRKTGKTAATILTVLSNPDSIVVVPTEQRRDELVAAAVPERQIIVLPPAMPLLGQGGSLARCRWPM